MQTSVLLTCLHYLNEIKSLLNYPVHMREIDRLATTGLVLLQTGFDRLYNAKFLYNVKSLICGPKHKGDNVI